jgi:hypothetical protein
MGGEEARGFVSVLGGPRSRPTPTGFRRLFLFLFFVWLVQLPVDATRSGLILSRLFSHTKNTKRKTQKHKNTKHNNTTKNGRVRGLPLPKVSRTEKYFSTFSSAVKRERRGGKDRGKVADTSGHSDTGSKLKQ